MLIQAIGEIQNADAGTWHLHVSPEQDIVVDYILLSFKGMINHHIQKNESK